MIRKWLISIQWVYKPTNITGPTMIIFLGPSSLDISLHTQSMRVYCQNIRISYKSEAPLSHEIAKLMHSW